jgi:hypothetical protein
VDDTERVLFHRGGAATVLGALAYVGFDLLILWLALLAVHAHPTPGFAIVVMAYIIGALGGSLPLPASIGTIGGIAGMLILYGVHHNPAVAAVLLHQAIGLLVPVAGARSPTSSSAGSSRQCPALHTTGRADRRRARDDGTRRARSRWRAPARAMADARPTVRGGRTAPR